MADELESKRLSTFAYRDMECEVRVSTYEIPSVGWWVCGYMTGHIDLDSYDAADEVASAHGGFNWYRMEEDGRVTLGFDTAHWDDGPDTQDETFVTQAIKEAVDSLYTAGVVKEVTS